jgi:hypothetical protein
MKSIYFKRLAQKVLTSCTLVVFIASCSMITLATESKPVGELLVTGSKSTDGTSVTVNGEPAKSGRTIFSSSTISTPEHSGAMINLGKAGKLQLAPGSIFVLTADGNALSGDLTAGSITVVNSVQSVGVRTLTGDMVALNAGETATANSGTSTKKAKPGPGGLDWWYWAAIIGGAAAAVVIIVVVSDDDDENPSPVR